MKEKLRNPNLGMKLAVNAKLEDNQQRVDELVQKHDLDPEEVEARSAARTAPYKTSVTRRRSSRGKTPVHQIVSKIDNSVSVVGLVLIQHHVQELLAAADKEVVDRVKQKIQEREQYLRRAKAVDDELVTMASSS